MTLKRWWKMRTFIVVLLILIRKKAFVSMEWDFIYRVLERMRFGTTVRRYIWTWLAAFYVRLLWIISVSTLIIRSAELNRDVPCIRLSILLNLGAIVLRASIGNNLDFQRVAITVCLQMTLDFSYEYPNLNVHSAILKDYETDSRGQI